MIIIGDFAIARARCCFPVVLGDDGEGIVADTGSPQFGYGTFGLGMTIENSGCDLCHSTLLQA
jgi:hypothetical protein